MKNPVIIWGGADIDPSLYGEQRNGCGWTNIRSDQHELDKIDNAIKEGRPIIGICRGLQILTVHQGGKLIQHITPQGGTKFITDTITKEHIPIVKAHHQVCIPNKQVKHHILAESFIPEDNITIPEIIYYPEINAIGFQGHPEWSDDKQTKEYIFNTIKKYLNIDMNSWRE